jgi:hypothetical protein
MAKKRMISQQICDSDPFLDMPLSSQNLYFHLILRADDDGFVDNAKSIIRKVGGSQDDLMVLISKRFVLTFDNSSVIVIKHWKLHNTIQCDRYHKTIYQQEMDKIVIGKDNIYEIGTGDPLPKPPEIAYNEPKVEVVSKPKKTMFVAPTVEEIAQYIKEKSYQTNAQQFWNYYENKGWCIGSKKMKNWKLALDNWEIGRFTSVRQKPIISDRILPDWINDQNEYMKQVELKRQQKQEETNRIFSDADIEALDERIKKFK